MSVKNNLKLLDMDEYLREHHSNQHEELLAFCNKYDLILDLASSDVCMYLEDNNGNCIGLG